MTDDKKEPKRVCPACKWLWSDHRTSEIDVCLFALKMESK